jgi:hypothetical protein
MVKKKTKNIVSLIHLLFFNTLPTFIFQIHITCWMSPSVGTTRAHKLIYRQYLNVWFISFGCWGKIQWMIVFFLIFVFSTVWYLFKNISIIWLLHISNLLNAELISSFAFWTNSSKYNFDKISSQYIFKSN